MAGLRLDRRALVVGGMILALLAGLAVAFTYLFRGGAPVAEPSGSGLVVETGRADDVKLDPARPLRCFVDGRSVGELTLRDCAARNGVATGALNVGLDPTGALSAAGAATSEVTPLPPPQGAAEGADAAAAAQPVSDADAGSCWRYGDGGWDRLPDDAPLQACVRTLFAGQCQPPGTVSYGRWGSRTLRLTGGVVQISEDNRNFRVLLTQDARCGIP